MPTNVSVSYESLTRAVSTLDDGIQKYQEIIDQLQLVLDTFGNFYGSTAQIARQTIEQEQNKLREMKLNAFLLREGVQDTLNDIQNKIDPGIAARFTR